MPRRRGARRNKPLDAAPQAGVDADDACDVVAARHDDMLEAMFVGIFDAENASKSASAGRMFTSRSMTSRARRIRNILACKAFGMKWPRPTSLMV